MREWTVLNINSPSSVDRMAVTACWLFHSDNALWTIKCETLHGLTHTHNSAISVGFDATNVPGYRSMITINYVHPADTNISTFAPFNCFLLAVSLFLFSSAVWLVCACIFSFMTVQPQCNDANRNWRPLHAQSLQQIPVWMSLYMCLSVHSFIGHIGTSQ